MFGHTFSFKRMGRYVLTFYWYCTSSKLRAFGALGGLGPWGVTLFVQPCSTTHTHKFTHALRKISKSESNIKLPKRSTLAVLGLSISYAELENICYQCYWT